MNLNNNYGWKEDDDRKVLWATSYYSLWRWHNKETYDNSFNRLSFPEVFIRTIVSDHGSENLASRIILHQQSEVQLIRWVFPPIGWVKLILMELRI